MTQQQELTVPDLNRWFRSNIIKANKDDSRDFMDWRTPVNWMEVVPAEYMDDFLLELSRRCSTEVYANLTDEQYSSSRIVSQAYNKEMVFSSNELRARSLYKVMVGETK